MDDIGGVWRTVGGRRIFIKDGKSLSEAMIQSGKFHRNGLGANNKYTKEDHPKPKKLGKLDNMSEENVIRTLKYYEKKIKNDKIENAIVITSDGEIYQCFGNEDNVWPNLDLGGKINGGYITHNHPKSKDGNDSFSFSDADTSLFKNNNIKILRRVDYKYQYENNSSKKPVLKQPSWMDEMEDDSTYYHLKSIKFAIDNDIYYMRWKNVK